VDSRRFIARDARFDRVAGVGSGVEARERIGYEPTRGGRLLLDTRAYVETPERVRFRHQLAGPGRRAVAWGIDTVLRIVVVLIGVFVLSFLVVLPSFFSGAGMGLIFLLIFVVEWFYGVGFEIALAGRTPGKWMLSLRVVRVDGSPARVPDLVLRNFLRAVDYFPIWAPLSESFAVPTFGVAVLTMTLDPKLRRIGDLVGGTVVVVEDRDRIGEDVVIDPPVTEEERQELPAQVLLSRDELRILEDFVRRRRRLSKERAEELAELYAPALSERTGVEAPTAERVLVLAFARATGRDR